MHSHGGHPLAEPVHGLKGMNVIWPIFKLGGENQKRFIFLSGSPNFTPVAFSPNQIASQRTFTTTALRMRVCAQAFQSCPTLCDPTDGSLPGSSVQGFSRQEYWSGLLCPPQGDLPDPGIKPISLTSPDWQAGSLPLVPPVKPSCVNYLFIKIHW